VALADGGDVEARRAAAVDQDVGVGEQVLGPAHHRPLGRVQEPEEGGVLTLGEVDPGRRPPTERVAVLGFGLDHVGPGVGQQLGGVGPGDLRRRVDDPQPAEHADTVKGRL
jgi:hypothetical protein